jgi:DNA-binding NtrC family response regulator
METKGRILIVDDEVNARTALAEILRDEGYGVDMAADGFKALPKLDDFAPEAVVTDLRMPGMDGLELMRRVHAGDPDTPVVVVTAYGAVDSAVQAMRRGAADYITKPVNVDELLVVLERALETRRMRAEAQQLRQRLAEREGTDSVVGSSAAMKAVLQDVVRVAPSRASVLITGESGTGKELLAAAIHRKSARAQGPFVKLHCAALAETLLESELFGHERGAFTGAVSRRDGRFKQADGGTLFLDEVGEISPSVQIKLLRFLQEHEFERVGGNETIKVDVRIVAATNRDLLRRVGEGLFREDLYYRLNVFSLHVPPLREHPSDIPILAMHFLSTQAAENGKELEGFSSEAMALLTHHSWPGNVRELENAVERAVVMARGKAILPEDLPPALASARVTRGEDGPGVPGSTLAELERWAILRTLELTGGSTSRAAEILGTSRRNLHRKIKQYNLKES